MLGTENFARFLCILSTVRQLGGGMTAGGGMTVAACSDVAKGNAQN